MFIALSAYIFLISGRVRIPLQILPILSFSVFYLIFGLMNPYISPISILKIFVCAVVWLAGYMLIKNKKFENIKRVILAASLGMAIHGIINFLYNIAIGTNFYDGRSYDFWSKSLSTSTGQAINFTLLASVLIWTLFMQKNKLLKLFVGVLYVSAFIYNVLIGGRTFIILTGTKDSPPALSVPSGLMP